MAVRKSVAKKAVTKKAMDPFRQRSDAQRREALDPILHVYRDHVVCKTDTRGYATPRNHSRIRIVVDATDGFIPLWKPNVSLRWRFQAHSMSQFEDAAAAERSIEALLADAILAWGDAVPVKFAKRDDQWDFEIVVRERDDCDTQGCVLAQAFFPDAGRHELYLFPKLFEQSKKEQIETLAHEIGHIFGLRHFFANVSEKRWKSEIFGKHNPFSVMNYGAKSHLTNADRSDLRRLYRMAWNGELTSINGTPIRLVRPYHTRRSS